MPEIKKNFLKFAKPFFKQLPSFLLIVIACVILATILLCSTFLLLPQISSKYIVESAHSFVGKPARESVFDWCFAELDNWTDALILQISTDNRDESAINRALLAYHGTNNDNDGNPASAIVKHYVDGKEYDNPNDTYGRYWHGYILFIRPLLSVMSYSRIRVVNGILQSFLTLTIIILLFKKKLKCCVIPYTISILLLNPVLQAMSLQYSPCFYIFSIGSIVAIALSDKQMDSFYPYLFLLIGIGTSFFDFLTYPISTLGIPLVFYLCRIEHNKFSNLITCVITWCIGYAGMWIGKWVVANLVTNINVLSSAILGVRTRTSFFSQNSSYSPIKTIFDNLKFYFLNPISLASLFFLFFCIVRLFQQKSYNKKRILCYAIPYILICLLPIIWYLFTLNHSAIHSIYTNKACTVICFSLLCLFSHLSLSPPNIRFIRK